MGSARPHDGEAGTLHPSAGADVHRFALAVDDEGKRIDRVLADRLPAAAHLSRTRLQALITEGHVRVDGTMVRVPDAKVGRAGEVIVAVPPPLAAEPQPEAIALTIVFEDAHLLVLDKPAGLVVHPAAGHEDGTLVNALIAHCGDSLSGIGGVRRPGIVHRLDKETSGLMVVAKTDAAHHGLAALFADHGRTGSLERRYRAIVWGHPSAPSGTIDRPLGRHPLHREKISVVPLARGRHAVTHWRVERLLQGSSLIECTLETGRTHQIRVHMTEIGHPLIGDPVYGKGFRTKAARLDGPAAAEVATIRRQALHAATLGFDHPLTGKTLRFDSALPNDLDSLLKALGTAA